MKTSSRLLAATLAVVIHGGVIPSLRAQDRLIGEAALALEPSFNTWRFTTALPNESLLVKQASQLVIPLSLAFRLGSLTIDAGAAYAMGRVTLKDGRRLDLDGVSDVRVRGVVHVAGNNVLLTFGVNAPSGKNRLSGTELDAVQVIGAPALGFSVPYLGSGLGVTGGLVVAWRVGSWAVGLASSVETRRRYTPIEALIAGVRVPTDLEAGLAYRASLGVDRVIGNGRLSLLVAGDYFGQSRLVVNTPGGVPNESRYRLGPQVSANLLVDLGVRGFQTFAITLADRYRTQFTGFDGTKAPGSSGNRFDGSLDILTGSPGKLGLMVRLDARLDGGLEVDNSIATAAMTSGGVTLGLVAPFGGLALRPFVRGQVGHLDIGPAATGVSGYGGGIAIIVRGSR